MSLVDRDLMVRTARGFFAETIDARWAGGAVAATSGVASFIAVGLYAGDKVSNLTIYVATAGAGLTLSKVGLYSSTGAQLGVSADQGTSWQSAGAKTVPLITPYSITADGIYYVSTLVVGTTGPSIVRGGGGNVVIPFSLPGFLSHLYAQTGLSDLPAQASFATGVTTAHAQWVGLS